MSDPIIAHDHDDWVEITLNRPEKLNAFDDAMHAELQGALDAAKTEACRAILLTGAGRGFCTGQDLRDRDPDGPGGPPDLGDTLTRLWNPLVRRLRGLPVPVVCAVNGVAAGAGANLALACDIVLAARSARFIQSFSRVGLIPDAGGSWMLPRLIGEARAKAVAMTARSVTADEAEGWGMIWRAVDDDALMDDARALTAELAAGPTYGLVQTRAAIGSATARPLNAHLDVEAETQARCGASPDYAEGVRAFLNKRPPAFSGRPP